MLDFGSMVAPGDLPLPVGIATESGRRTRPVGELRAHLSAYLQDYGITRVAHLTGFDYVGLNVHMAVKPQGRSLSSGSGKGPTPDASWVSAVMECCEQAVWESLDVDSVHASRSVMQKLGVTVADGFQLPKAKGAIWHDDEVEIFIDANGDGKTYAQILVNGAGKKAEFLDQNATPIGTRVAAHVTEGKCWELELMIPYKGLCVKPPKPGDVWRINIVRQRLPTKQSGHQLITWAPLEKSFFEIQNFGPLKFK